MSYQKKKTQGNHLKEVTLDFLVDEKLEVEQCISFLEALVEIIDTELVSLSVNNLPPGFDILVGIKESCIYFGYWAEHNYVHIIVSSCKEFDHEKVQDWVQSFFGSRSIVRYHNNHKVVDIVEKLKCKKNQT